MAYLGKDFEYVRQENVEESLAELALPEDVRDFLNNFHPIIRLEKNDDGVFTLTLKDHDGVILVSNFVDGTVTDTPVGDFEVKTVFKMDGDTLCLERTFPDDKNLTTVFEFSENELIASFTINNWEGMPRKYYKSI